MTSDGPRLAKAASLALASPRSFAEFACCSSAPARSEGGRREDRGLHLHLRLLLRLQVKLKLRLHFHLTRLRAALGPLCTCAPACLLRPQANIDCGARKRAPAPRHWPGSAARNWRTGEPKPLTGLAECVLFALTGPEFQNKQHSGSLAV